MFRRSLLIATAAAPLAACGIFSSATINGVTTVTVNIAKLNAYVQAISNGVKTLLSIPLVSGALGAATVLIVSTALADLAAASAALNTEAAGSASLVFTTASIPAALTAFQKDAATIGNAFAAVLTAEGVAAAGTVTTTVNALETIVSVVQALTTLGATPDEAKVTAALAVLGVQG